MSESTPKGSQPQNRISEFVIEIAARKNSGVYFHPARIPLRGEWKNGNLFDSARAGEGRRIRELPDIPGLHVRLDLVNSTGHIIDPLEKNPALMHEISDKLATCEKYMRRGASPCPPRSYKLEKNDLATWMYWMVRLVIDRKARVVKGPTDLDLEAVYRMFPDARIRRDWTRIRENRDPKGFYEPVSDLAAA